MNTQNNLYTIGNGNIDLQSIANSNITINYNSETNIEVKEKKKLINGKIVTLLNLLAEYERIYQAKEILPTLNEEELFDDIAWDDLIESIKNNSCVIFIGPEISTDNQGRSLHEIFNESVSNRKLEYNLEDGFFMPGSDKQITEKYIKLKAMTYYGNKFNEQNILGQQLVENIAKIPFPLFISVAPDQTLRRVFNTYDMPHYFCSYNELGQDTPNPTKENPLIYNLLGNPGIDGHYIFTHEQFYNYMHFAKKIRVPSKIENTITDSIHYLFVGIDFDKWYNRLLMFSLGIDAEGYSCLNKDIEEANKTFIEQQFKITSVQGSYKQFIDTLLYKCKQNDLYKPLFRYFIEKKISEVSTNNIATMKTNNEGELQEIIYKMDELIEKTIKNIDHAR